MRLSVAGRAGIGVVVFFRAAAHHLEYRAGSGADEPGHQAATGSFGHPYLPALPGQDEFTGRLQHVASYRSPWTMPASAWP
jgi:hypothetical protein